MLLLKLISCLCMVYLCEGEIRRCNDCTPLPSCSPAKKYVGNLDRKTIAKIRGALCGFVNKNQPKVCCSDFDDEDTSKESYEGIENHRNFKLLPDSCGDINGDHIVGGTVAKLHEFPWMALISYHVDNGLKFKCAGSIINSRYILTAAHCVRYQSIAGVRVGEYDIRYKQDCQGQHPNFICESHIQDELVDEKIFHDNFDFSGGSDIALLRLRRPIDFSYKNVQPICLPITKKLRNNEINGRVAEVAGWGLTEFNRESSVLLKVNITVHTDQTCKSSDRSTEFCAGDLHKDTCDGDSGGPLMLEDEYKGVHRNIQYGIVSRGPDECGTAGTLGIYTDVRKYMEWILDNIRP